MIRFSVDRESPPADAGYIVFVAWLGGTLILVLTSVMARQ